MGNRRCWEVVGGEGGAKQKLRHVDGTEVKLPAEVPDDAEVKDPALFYKASVGKGMVMVPMVKILQSPEEVGGTLLVNSARRE